MRQDSTKPERVRVPQASANDYTPEMELRRREFARAQCQVELTHTAVHSLDPAHLAGNIEGFFGVTQVPLGLAGPLRVEGEHARGDFFVPLATTEAALVETHSWGMRLVDECGGVKTTIADACLPRAPAFTFPSAREARDFTRWVREHFAEIKEAAERGTSIGKLHEVRAYVAGPHAYLRCEFSTGGVSGQNVTHKATLSACEWIRERHPLHPSYQLAGGIDGDERHASINTLLGRGRRVVAEIALKPEPTQRILGVSVEALHEARALAQLGHGMAGSAHSGGSPASGLAALFIATGQDVAHIAESHAGLVYTRLTQDGALYWSLTLPALVVGTYGGGTTLPTQREALSLLGCYGKDKANKFAELCAALALVGDIAWSAMWLPGAAPQLQRYARNRP